MRLVNTKCPVESLYDQGRYRPLAELVLQIVANEGAVGVLAFIVLFELVFFWSFDLATLLLFVFMVAAGLLGALRPKLLTWVYTQRRAYFHSPNRVQQDSSISLSRSL